MSSDGGVPDAAARAGFPRRVPRGARLAAAARCRRTESIRDIQTTTRGSLGAEGARRGASRPRGRYDRKRATPLMRADGGPARRTGASGGTVARRAKPTGPARRERISISNGSAVFPTLTGARESCRYGRSRPPRRLRRAFTDLLIGQGLCGGFCAATADSQSAAR